MSQQSLEIIDIKKLLKLLPHRYPFLLLDKIIDVDDNESATGIKNITFNEPQFTGHFPENPIMPGVLIIEAMAQTAGAICANKFSAEAKNIVFFMTIDNAKFRRPVVPGDVLELRVKKLKQRKNIFKYQCEAWVGDDKAAEAIVGAMLAPETEQ